MNYVNPAAFNPLTPSSAGAAGQTAGQQFSMNPVYNTYDRRGMVLDPLQQAQLAQQMANQAANDEAQRQFAGAAYSAGLGNQLANLSNQRQMVINAQQNAAGNVANQLASLNQRAATSANAIAQAMGSVGQYIR